LASAEQITLYDLDDHVVDKLTLPPGYMDGFEVREVVILGRRFVEGGRVDSFYGRGQFAEVPREDASA
jgi:hypothetical protein